MDKKFTIVFPTRERIILLDKILNSIKLTTANSSEIEVLIAIDSDDVKTKLYFERHYFDFVKVFHVKRSLNFSKDYYNFLARLGTGKYIIAVNDDAVFESAGWDIIAWDILEEYIGEGPNIVHGWIADGLDGYRATGHGEYCCFPLIGREGFNALDGMIFPDRIPTWGADIWMRKIYDTIDRIVKIPITIRHYCHHNKTRDQDAISKRIANNQVPFDINPRYEEINALIAVLRKNKVTAS